MALELTANDAAAGEILIGFAVLRPAEFLTVPKAPLNEVGKEVAPGVFQVDPKSIRGKLLVVTPGAGVAQKGICIGVWTDGKCEGNYVTVK